MNITNFNFTTQVMVDQIDKQLLIYTAINETTTQLTQLVLTMFFIGVIVGVGATILYYKVLKK